MIYPTKLVNVIFIIRTQLGYIACKLAVFIHNGRVKNSWKRSKYNSSAGDELFEYNDAKNSDIKRLNFVCFNIRSLSSISVYLYSYRERKWKRGKRYTYANEFSILCSSVYEQARANKSLASQIREAVGIIKGNEFLYFRLVDRAFSTKRKEYQRGAARRRRRADTEIHNWLNNQNANFSYNLLSVLSVPTSARKSTRDRKVSEYYIMTC